MTGTKDILTLPHEQLEDIQLAGIKQTLVNCYENVPFYKSSFDAAGFDPRSVQTFDDLQNAPFTTKQDLRDNYPYGMLAVPLKDVREIHMSSVRPCRRSMRRCVRPQAHSPGMMRVMSRVR